MLQEEGGHAHNHGTGVRWLDLIATFAIVSISVISLVVSINHGDTMEDLVHENRKMVEASTLPYLQAGFQNVDPVSNRRVAGLVVENAGVGPAIIDWLEISYNGHPAANARELFHACCTGEKGHVLRGFTFSTPSGRVLPAKESLKAYWFDSIDPADRSYFDQFSNAQSKISYRGCYCSVLNECWISKFDGARPQRVGVCKLTGVVPFH